jgi:hypothetical protein
MAKIHNEYSLAIDDDVTPEHIPLLVYPKLAANNLVLIDSLLYDSQLFVNSCNSNTLPIIYSYNSTHKDLIDAIRSNFTKIDRISFVFHDSVQNGKIFLENTILVDSNNIQESINFKFLVSIINEFKVKNIDFLACNTLQYDEWKLFYHYLTQATGVTVGASNDKTGNIKYGGNWIMESTNEDIQNIYFNSNINNYAGYLDSTISQAGGVLQFRQIDLSIQYNINNTDWITTTSSSWPISIVNNNPSSESILTVSFTTNITISNATVGTETNGYFICGSDYITFEGNNNTITVDGVTNYPGFIQNGLSNAEGKNYITVQNFSIASVNSSTVAWRQGWLCQQSFGSGKFGTLIKNITNSAVIGPNDQCGSICGRGFGQGNSLTPNSSSAIVENCTNSALFNSSFGGGILGIRTAHNGGNVIVRNCSNTGLFNASNIYNPTNTNMGGIIGPQSGQKINAAYGTVLVENCYNTGNIESNYSGGICGMYAGNFGGFVTIKDCYNTGNITRDRTTGICAEQAGQDGGIILIENCYNLGNIISTTTNPSNGICGNYAGLNNGKVTINKCFNKGNLSGSAKSGGGIAGYAFGKNSNQLCSITNCYNTGSVFNDNCGGICGGLIGYSDNVAYTGNVLIENCYNAGNVGLNAGGIVGGWEGSIYATKPNVQIKNCYNNGTVLDELNGIIAQNIVSSINLTLTNTYAANGSWSDASAQSLLTGYPTSLRVNNPGTIWYTLNSNTPYLLVVFYDASPIVPICFPAGTPVQTDQGFIAIEKINTSTNTIRGNKIVAITKTVTIEDKIICIEKDSLGSNMPSQKTYISRNHKLLYNKQMIKAKHLIGQVDGVYNKKYNGDILYNVLLDKYDKMIVNNLIVETLNPENIIAKLYNSGYSEEEKNNIIVNINQCANEYKKHFGKLR